MFKNLWIPPSYFFLSFVWTFKIFLYCLILSAVHREDLRGSQRSDRLGPTISDQRSLFSIFFIIRDVIEICRRSRQMVRQQEETKTTETGNKLLLWPLTWSLRHFALTTRSSSLMVHVYSPLSSTVGSRRTRLRFLFLRGSSSSIFVRPRYNQVCFSRQFEPLW